MNMAGVLPGQTAIYWYRVQQNGHESASKIWARIWASVHRRTFWTQSAMCARTGTYGIVAGGAEPSSCRGRRRSSSRGADRLTVTTRRVCGARPCTGVACTGVCRVCSRHDRTRCCHYCYDNRGGCGTTGRCGGQRTARFITLRSRSAAFGGGSVSPAPAAASYCCTGATGQSATTSHCIGHARRERRACAK